MTKYKPLYALYKGLKEHGTDLPDSYGSFERSMTQAGDAGASNRRNFYQSLKDSNYDVPDTYEKFYESMFVPVNNTTSRARKIGETPMTEEDRKGFTLGAQDIRMNASKFVAGDALRYNKLKQKKQKQQKNFGRVNVGTNKTPYAPADNVVKDEGLNTYVTSDNGDTTNLDYAQQKQAVLDVQNKLYMDALDKGEIPMASETIDKNGLYDLQENIGKDGTEVTEEGLQDQWNAKLNYAYKRRDELNKELDAIRQKEGNALLSYSATFGDTSSQISDDHRTLDAAKRKVEEEIRNLEALTGKESSSFWTTLGYVANAIPILHNIKNGINYLFGSNTSRDMGKAVENSVGAAETWDFGLSSFDTYARLERIKAKVENKIPLTKAEQSFAQNMMAADKSAQLVNDNMGRAYRWTSVAGVSLPYMLDFFLTGGFSGMTKAAGKFAIKKAAQMELGTLGRTVTKYIGIGLGDVASSYAMAVTEQGLKTGADVMSRHLGSLYQDKDGNYAFGTFDENGNLLHEGGESFGKALYKGVTAAMLENYTEKMFTHWHLKRGAFKMMDYSPSLKKYADFFRHVGKSGWYGGSMNFMKKFGMGSYPEEVAEEIVNIPLNAALVGDNKFSELKDWKTWEDIVGSMAISVGSMAGMASAPHIVRGTVNQGVKAYDIAAFYVFKNRLNQADQRASEILGEDWERIKDRIDSAPNENLGTISADLHKQVAAGTFSEEQMDAAWAYIQNLRVMRGYNLAKTMEMQAKAMTGEENMPADIRQKQLNAAYAAGQETEGENKHLAQLEYEKQKFNLAKALGVSDSELEKMTDEQISYNLGMDDNLDNVIYNYQNAKAMYDGIVDNAQSAVDTAAKVASQRVDAMTNVEDGTIRQALIKGTNGMKDYPVYIISGNVETHDDGVINYTDSDNMIIIYNESTGRKETIPVSMLADVNPNIQNAEEVKDKAILEAKQKTITDLSNVVDGKLVNGSEFTMEDAQGNTHGYKIEDVDELGNCIVSMDGTLIPEPMPLDTIQQQYDQSNVARSVKNDQSTQEPEQTQQESQPLEDKFDYDKITNENDGKVKSVVVTDEEGKNRFPNSKAVFLIQDKGAMPKFVVMDEEGNLTSYVVKRGDKIQLSGEMTVDEYKKQRQEELQMIAAEDSNSSMIEENSGAIEADRGEMEVAEPIGTGAFGTIYNQFKGKVKEAFNFLVRHKSGDLLGVFHRDDVGDIDLVWGDEKMGLAHILGKHVGEGKDFETPDDAIAMIENVINSGRIFQDNQNRYTLMLDGVGVGIRKSFDGNKKNWIVTAVDFNRSQEEKGIVTNPTSTSHGVTEPESAAALNDSDDKDINNSANGNENNESLTFEDGTPIPVDENGETDLSQTDAAHAAEWYDNNLGEDADDWLDGEIKKAKKVLEQAQNKKVTGTKPSELVASKKEKEAAIADAQAHYDSAISIRDALKERQLAKVEDTAEGRKNLIEKARRKFARLKSAVNNDAEAVSQLYKDVVGSLLHRLYDGTGIDVTDTIPLTAEEYVASNLGAHSLNYEGTETSKGVKQETGLSREDFAKTQLLAADGKGTTIDDLVHSLWENRPSNLDSLNTQDIRNALLSVITSGFKASEARNYVENLRIATAEKFKEEEEKAADNAAFAEENKAESEQQTETAPESEEKTEEEQTEEKPEEKAADSEKINEQINEQINENINAPEVPEDATDENPLGAQRDSSPFSPKDNTKVTNSSEERKAMVEKNAVRSEDVLDHSIGKKMRKSLARIAKMMGADIVYLHSADSNGWYDEKTNTIYLALDSADVLGTQFVFGHEMTHEIKAKNPAAFEELKKVVKSTMGEDAFNAITDKTQQRYKKGGASYWNDRNAIEEEVVADQIGSWLHDANYAHTLMMKMSHPLLAKLHEIVNRIRMAFTGTEYSDNAKLILRSIEQAYVKTANGEITNSETGEDVSFSLRQKPEPKKKGIGYKVFVLKDGKLYPPMVANPDGAETPVGVWLDADAAPIAGESKTGRPQVKQGGKGTQGGSGKLAYRPGWHLGVVPYAIQFNRKDTEGNKTLSPKNCVFAEVEYAADVDYQEEARQEGINPSGKYQHSLAGLKHLPTDGYYMYRTNPNPETDPWVITGAMKVNRILTRAEQADLVSKAGREPQQIQEGDIVTDDVVNSINQEIANAPKFSLKVYHGSGADFTEFDFDHMGEGAGSQVFGWGGYVTSSKKIGKNYATLMDNDPSRAYYRIQHSNGTRFAKKYPTLESFLHGDKQIAMNDKFTEQEKIDFHNEMKKLAEPYHNLYEVDIPDDNGSNYMDWDKPLSKNQQDAIREGLEHLGVGIKTLESKGQSLERTGENIYNSTLYIGLIGTEYDLPERTKGISKFLSSVGFTGVKYKAGRNFGGAKKGDTNYVIFKPEDMRITEHTKFSIKTYHGSQASFDKFDHSFMGSGEGAQAYGWGTYVSEVEGIAKAYAKQNARKHKGEDFAKAEQAYEKAKSKYDDTVRKIADTELEIKMFYEPTFERTKELLDKAISNNSTDLIKRFTERVKETENDLNEAQQKLDNFKSHIDEYYNSMVDAKKKYDSMEKPKRNLYSVDIPDDTGRNYIGWDEPLGAAKIMRLPKVFKADGWEYKKVGQYDTYKIDGNEHEVWLEPSLTTGKELYRDLTNALGSDKAASEFLSKAGFVGVKVIAQRNAGGNKEGRMNYVIFDENNAQITSHTKFSLKDNQGNPLNQDGTLKLDKIKSVDELTDEDFLHPTRNVELPSLPKKIADAIGTEGKPVVIKKNIFERNYMRHKDVTPELSKVIFKSALYDPDLYGQNQKKTRPYNWVLINTKDEKGNNRTVLLEVNPNKDNVEIVHWHFVDERGLKKIKKQADREDGQLLILPSNKEEVGALSDPTVNLSAAKIDNSSETTKENGEKVDGEGTKFSLKDEKVKSVAEKFGVNEDDVAMYANAVERGSTADAARARANIKRHLLLANEDKISSFKELIKYTKPVNEALKENFGDLDAMIEERRKQVEAERNAMEAARKRAQEEEEKKQKHLEELSLIPTDELDKRYMDAIDNNDESTAREMLDESARRKGYGDANSNYQGQGAWAAPSNPQYESDEARRADIESSPDVNLEDIALGYSLQPDDYFDNPRAYMNNTAYGLESARVIKNALDAIKNGEKDVKVKVYRAVPTSVKEGKLRNGDWVTPSKKYAEMHGDHRLEGKYRIIEDEVPANQLWWDGNDANEFGFDDGKEYRYKNAKNNRKLNDLITYDNKGNVIPPSKRFNSRKSDIRFSLAGERGAAAADKAEERTARMDNLSVARKMEEEKKDAKAIKMATGWERGADGKWRYEMPDAKIKDTMNVGGGHIVKRYEDDMLWNGGKLSEVIDAPELFKAYPQLKDVRIETDAIMNDMPSNGEYNSKTNTITIHADELKYMNSILNHETQHVIQSIEGFDRGGSPRLVRGEIKKRLAEVTKQIRQLRAEGKEDEAKAIVEKNRGLYNAYQANDDYNSYKSLAGEVEARNVQERMNMTPDERRKTLAESTEDVARKDQIFLGVGNTKFSLRGSTPYDKQMEEWKEKNHLEKDAAPMEKPIKQDDENIFDYMNRMVEWTRNQNLWKTAPKQTGFQDALAKWKADNGLSPDAYPPVRPHREYYSSEIGYAEDLEEYNKKKELWKSAPKPKDFDLSFDLEDMNKQLRNIRRAVLNQKNYDQRTVKAVSDLVRKMLNIGWGDGLSRGKVGNILSAAKNATGANDVKKYLDKAMGILAENYLNRLTTAYDNLINTKGARADQSGVIKMGSLDAKGQAFMSEYKKAINMDDKSLNTYIANIEEDSAKNEDNVEMNDYRLAGIQAAIMYKQQIGGNDADISELQRQIGELKNKKDATKEDKDLLKSLEKKLFENKFDRITMYENLLNNIQRMVKESKGMAKEFREEIAEHKNEILHRANLDLEGVDSTYYDTTTAKKKLVNNDLQRAVFSSTYTFEQFLKFFGKKAANGEGYLYNYFTKLNQDALDEEQLYNEMNRNALDEKTKELFGKKKFMKLVGIDGKGMKEMDIEVTDYSNKKTGKRTIHLKQGQMLYIYLVNKETDGEMKLRAMGITEEDVAAIEENLDPRVKAMGEWLQDEYLPECQRRYQATHTKYFGAPMKEVENYFPLAINNRARNVKEDVNQDSDAMSQLAGTSTGAIVTRRVNVIPLDIENADAFEVAFNHLQEMEEWSAMLPFRQDVNTLLSYTHFRNQVQNMSSVAYGSGKTLWDEFKQTAQIAAGTYKPKVNAGMMDSRIAAAMGGIAVAKISGRLWTAIKQSQSATVFLPECDFTRFVKNGVNPYGSWKWAMENIPDFRKRVENMTYGDVKLRQYLDELEKLHDWTKTISKIGMAPNILVDGITCAVGARSVYETEVNRLTKLGYPKEKAEEKAYYKAVAAYNKTQQSSGGMYLSPMQVDRTYASAALSLFKNANYAYGRMQIEACRGLARTYDFWGGKHKTALIESMTRQIMEEDGLDENTARAIAKATYNRTFRQSIGRLINFATLVPVSWALYKVLPYLLTGDDDDKKKDMIEEAVLKGFATSLSDNYVIPFASNILNAGLKVEDGKPTFDPEVFRYQNLYINPATSDLANIYSMIGNQKWYSFVNKVGMLGVQSLIGFNPETVGALYQAFAEADYDGDNTAKEWQIGVLTAISAPEESIRELYMDELGLKSGDKDAMKKFMSLAGLDADDIKKVPLAELEKRYAKRQINRDNLLTQIGMDAEDFNSYVDKYQQSFEKKIKDKMDKWDEYDKKKADQFFDTTSDPKLKDMIAKKRTKDANAAADEQIAKEGPDQEKKGKGPSEEAYDAVKMSIDVAEDNAISTYNKVLNKRYAALNDEYNDQTDAMKYIFMSNHPNFKAYKDLESEYTNYGKKVKELKEKLVSADGYDAKQAILKQIRAERDKFYELQSKVR